MTFLQVAPIIAIAGLLATIGACITGLVAIWKIARHVDRDYWSMLVVPSALAGLVGFAALRVVHEAFASV
jgi:uncharacterized membrane protein